MNIFVIANNLPSRHHTGFGAVTMVQYHVIDQLRLHGHGVVLQNILQGEDRRALSAAERDAIVDLERLGARVLPPIFRSDYARSPSTRFSGHPALQRAGRVWRRWFPTLEHLYPAVRLRPLIDERLADTAADVVFVFWNPEGVAATYGNRSVPRAVYYGMPDHAPALARLGEPALFGLSLTPRQARARVRAVRRLERYHLQLMLDCDVLMNLGAEQAAYYARAGHPRSVYMQNMWPEAPPLRTAVFRSAGDKPKIVGSLGTLHSTGNTFGLTFIGEALRPRLDSALGPDGYEIHIYGEGTLAPSLRRLLDAPAIRLRGFVEDIDAEIAGSDVFLVANNTGPYKGSHTRFLHAWSLRACCVAHAESAPANPEMVHMGNVLLGANADEMVTHIVRAVRDPELRQRIADGGWQTFKACFTPEVVTGRLLAEMETVMARRRAGRRG